MKILFNTHQTSFQYVGGGEMIMLKLADELRDNGIQIKFFDQWTDKIKDFDIIHEFNCFNWWSWGFYKEQGIKTVITPTMWKDFSSAGLLKHQLKQKALGVLDGGNYPNRLETALGLPDLFLPTTKIEGDRLIEYFSLDPRKFKVLSNAVNAPKGIVHDVLFPFPKNEYLLFVGSIAPNKRLKELIHFSKVHDYTLVVVGGAGQNYEEYESNCRSFAAGSNIHFVGKLENSSLGLAWLYQNAAMLIAPSDFETCSLVGLEAGSYGTPVVMTAIGGTQEIYKDTVCYINPLESESWREAVEGTFQKNGIDHRLKRHIHERYLWPNISKALVEHYKSLLS